MFPRCNGSSALRWALGAFTFCLRYATIRDTPGWVNGDVSFSSDPAPELWWRSSTADQGTGGRPPYTAPLLVALLMQRRGKRWHKMPSLPPSLCAKWLSGLYHRQQEELGQ